MKRRGGGGGGGGRIMCIFLLRGGKNTPVVIKKKVEFKASPQIYGGGFFPLLTKNFSLIVNIPRVNFGNTPPSPAGNWISGARRSCQSESIPGQHF